MRSLNSTQQSLVASASKRLTWLFTVTTGGGSTYRWSTKAVSYGGNTYSFKVIPESFAGITLNRSLSEAGIQAPSSLTFDVSNSANALTASDFVGATVQVDLVLSDWTTETSCAAWKFRVLRCEARYQRLSFTCEDFVQQYLQGDYPKTPLIRDLVPNAETDPRDNLCVPIVFGTGYVPLRSVYVSGDAKRYYVLGPSSCTYTVSSVHSPVEWAGKSEWSSGSYTFNQYTKTLSGADYKVLEPIIADSNSDGIADAVGLWKQGERFLDMPARLSRSDLSSTTNPANAIAYILQDMGVPSADIDTSGSFASAASTFSGWGLSWNGGLYYREPRRKVLSRLLTMCHAALVIEDKIKLKVLSKTSQATLDTDDILRSGLDSPGTFRYQGLTPTVSDSGYGAYCESATPQSKLRRFIVPVDSTTDSPTSETVELPWVSDSQQAQRLAVLHFQRALPRQATVSFDTKLTMLALQPDDVITISHASYGGTYTVLIDSMRIHRTGKISFTCTRYSISLQDWGDISPSAISYASDSPSSTYTVVVAGPDGTASSGSVPNSLQGRLRLISGSNTVVLDPSALSIAVFQGSTEKARLGDLTGISGASGMGLWTGNGFFTGSITSTSGTIGGWTIGSTTLTGGNATLSSTGVLTLGTSNDVVIVSAVDPTYRLWIGNATAASAPFRVTKAGVLTATGATITGSITSTSGSIGGFTLAATTLTATNLILDSANQKITLGSGNDIVILDAADATYRFWVGNAMAASAPFRVTKAGAVTATSATITGSITSTSGAIGGWTIATTTISAGDLTLDSANTRIQCGASSSNYVRITPSGIIGVSSALGTTFDLPSDGSAPTFSSGVIKEVTYEIYTSGAIKTAADPASTGGVLINSTGIKGYSAAGTLRFNLDATTGGITSAYGTIGGWSISSTTLSAGAITLNSANSITVDQGADIVLMGGTNSNPSVLVLEDDGGSSFVKGGELRFCHATSYNYYIGARCDYIVSPTAMIVSFGPNGAYFSYWSPELIIGYDYSSGVGPSLSYCLSKIIVAFKTSLVVGVSGYTTKPVTIYGNLGLGTATFGTSAASVLCITNGTAPSSSPANSVQLYAQDVSYSSELKVRDEAGNVTTLSPHNFSLFEPAADDPYPWSYYAENRAIGKRINVDMSGAIRELERLSGKRFIYVEDVPVTEDWRATQREAALQQWIDEHTVEEEVTAEEALAPPQLVEVEDREAQPMTRQVGYELAQDGTVRTKTEAVYPRKSIVQRGLRSDCRFDSATGRFYRRVVPGRSDAEAALAHMLETPPGPRWLLARLAKEGSKTMENHEGGIGGIV